MDTRQVEPIVTARLRLEPLSVGYAPAMVTVLADPSLYEFTGGAAPTRGELEARYAAQTAGPADESEWWLNWVVLALTGGEPAGFVQATVKHDGAVLVADIAWVISTTHQGHGIASEATRAMVRWLQGHDVGRFTAHIHPAHHASMAVARHQSLHPTSTIIDGEIRWES